MGFRWFVVLKFGGDVNFSGDQASSGVDTAPLISVMAYRSIDWLYVSKDHLAARLVV